MFERNTNRAPPNRTSCPSRREIHSVALRSPTKVPFVDSRSITCHLPRCSLISACCLETEPSYITKSFDWSFPTVHSDFPSLISRVARAVGFTASREPSRAFRDPHSITSHDPSRSRVDAGTLAASAQHLLGGLGIEDRAALRPLGIEPLGKPGKRARSCLPSCEVFGGVADGFALIAEAD